MATFEDWHAWELWLCMWSHVMAHHARCHGYEDSDY